MMTSNQILGSFLRARRERLPAPPTQGRRRRTPGLRREEVAETCGVSTTWYTWLEQGRDVSASSQVLARLADTLRLGSAERAYLFELAGRHDPAAPEPGPDLPPEVLALPLHMTVPAYVLDRTWAARAWNDEAAHLFAGWLDGDNDRNLLRYIFLSDKGRDLIADWEDRGRRVVAEFRADYGHGLNDPALQALIDQLNRESTVFRRYWQEQAVQRREGGERRFNHPSDGTCLFLQSTLVLASDPGVKLVSLSPVPVRNADEER
ncbi:helix-turn-helix transcriptional regulator [Telmatospirillum siberiense]|nr:helix-turn-helix transcriptional regulator [Telmatospirillum siberiense]